MNTIRNKSSDHPIITFDKALFKAFLEARPESVTLAIAKHCADYKGLTGKSLHIDHVQEQALLQVRGANEEGVWASKYTALKGDLYFLAKAFEDGIMNQSKIHCDIADVLRRAEMFYDMLDLYLEQKPV